MKLKILLIILILSSLLFLYKDIANNHKEVNTFELTHIDLDMIKDLKAYTLVNFCSSNNSICNKFQPTLKILFNELSGDDIKIFNINIFENTELLNNFPINLIPIQFFFTKDGKSYKPSKTLGIEFQHSIMNEKDFYYHIGVLSKEEIIKIFNEMQLNQL